MIEKADIQLGNDNQEQLTNFGMMQDAYLS